HINPRHFDFVWAPAHDQLSGANVLSTLTSPHNLTPDILQNSARALRTTLLPTDFAGKVVSVLIGGASRAYKFSHATMLDLADQLAQLSEATPKHFFLISLSRRSHPDCADILRAKIPPTRLHIIEKTGDAAYPAMLGLADYIIATSDSTNMLGEACLTGKPIYRFDLAGGTARFRRFHNALENGGYVRPFIGTLEHWHSTPLNATSTIAQAIKNAMRQKAASGQ
ncbi:MAG: mitochondrial fission ELM1 family protein, partial [Gammaproteobacteria bacterium]